MPNLPGAVVTEPAGYPASLKRKLRDLRDVVEANIVHSTKNQCFFCNSSTAPQLKAYQQVLL